jgi:hypothetical protein
MALEGLYTFLKARVSQDDLVHIDENTVWMLVSEHCPSADYAHVDQLEGTTLNVTLYDDEYDDIGGFEITYISEKNEYKIFWDDDESDSE